MDADSIHLAVAEESFYNCVQAHKKANWEKLRQKTADISLKSDAKSSYPLELVAVLLKSKKT